MTDDGLALDSECFFITPIGDENSNERRRADGILAAVVAPAAEAHGLTAIRADQIAEGGNVTLQVIEHCIGAKVAVADLTRRNPNVYYEVGLRHAFRRPLVLIVDDNETLPFDLLQQRSYFYRNDPAGSVECRAAVATGIEKALAGHVDSPVDAAASLQRLSDGSALEQIVGELVEKVDGLGSQVRQVRRTIDHPRRVGSIVTGGGVPLSRAAVGGITGMSGGGGGITGIRGNAVQNAAAIGGPGGLRVSPEQVTGLNRLAAEVAEQPKASEPKPRRVRKKKASEDE
jgi:hypothetical protein